MIRRCKYHGMNGQNGKIVGSPIVRGDSCIQCLVKNQSRKIVPYEDFKKYQARKLTIVTLEKVLS